MTDLKTWQILRLQLCLKFAGLNADKVLSPVEEDLFMEKSSRFKMFATFRLDMPIVMEVVDKEEEKVLMSGLSPPQAHGLIYKLQALERLGVIPTWQECGHDSKLFLERCFEKWLNIFKDNIEQD